MWLRVLNAKTFLTGVKLKKCLFSYSFEGFVILKTSLRAIKLSEKIVPFQF